MIWFVQICANQSHRQKLCEYEYSAILLNEKKKRGRKMQLFFVC